jgi:cytochrome c oxidase assembly factor CtaG
LDWSWEPTVICGLLAAVAGYVVAVRRGIIAGDDDVSPWFKSRRLRPIFFAAGIATALIALQSPLDRGGDEYLFWLHMVQHLLLMMAAPPFLLLGICGIKALPRDRLSGLRRVWWAITRPWVALLVFNVVMLTWHLPALYDTTLTNVPVHVFEHLSFIAVGLVLWWPIIDPIRDQQTVTVSSPTRIAVLVVGGVPTTVLGLIFALAPSAFYSFYAYAPRLWGISPLGDQQIGGVVMLFASNLIFFVAILIIFMRMLSDPARDEETAAQRLAVDDAGHPLAGAVR